jgi:signal transduction histidine kinase/ActR/RegA family two-component response regulator
VSKSKPDKPGQHPTDAERLTLDEAVSELEATLRENQRLLQEVQAQAEALKEAEQRKDDFLANLAHDLRNRLAPLVTGLRILRMQPEGEQAEKTRNTMDLQLKLLTGIVDDLQGVAVVSDSRAELRKEHISLQAVVKAAMEASALYIKAGGHALTHDIPDGEIWLFGDSARLAEVVTNLLTNAAIYTAKGGTILLSIRHEGESGIVTVTDNGVGLAPPVLTKLKSMFAETGPSEHPRGGLGEGLVLVKNLVQMHGGTVSVESAGPGMGSTFTVELPAVESLATQFQPQSADPHKVLIVDDNVDAAQTAGWLMEKLGYSIELAHDGNTALDKALELRPEIILLDIGLPGRNGYEVCRELRKHPDFKRTLIIAQTGWGQKRDKDMAQLAGFDHHLTKPLSLESIAYVIGKGLPYR